VATNSVGIAVTWGGVAFAEVVDVVPQYAGSASRGRSVVWTDDAGSVTVECRGSANVSSSEYGLRKQIVISGGGMSLTSQAIYLGFTQRPTLNGVTQYSVTFQLLDN
jgi:hypothetical protein